MVLAEEHSNSLVVSAPEERMPLVADLIRRLDRDVLETTELRVFHLRNADAEETADLLSSLFGDTNSTSGNQGNGELQFAGPSGIENPFGGGTANGSRGAGQTARLQKQNRVVAVPDSRTGSVVVSAARDLMVQIGRMIADLDADHSRKQEVFVFNVQMGKLPRSFSNLSFPAHRETSPAPVPTPDSRIRREIN
jgi:type II secretory pathway component GspD/PulD (secretin)